MISDRALIVRRAANVASTVRSQARRAEANIHDAVHRMAEEVHAGSFNFNLYTGVLFLEGFFLLALAIACLAFPHQVRCVCVRLRAIHRKVLYTVMRM